MSIWHEKDSGLFYTSPEGRVIARVRKGLDTHYAESGNRLFGEYITVEAAKAAIEHYYSNSNQVSLSILSAMTGASIPA